MKINQIITENFDGEYDDEAGMVQSNLYTIAKAAQGLLDTIDDHDNLPEWVQEKIAKVEGMMVTSWNYLQSQKAQGIDPQIAESAEKRCQQCGMKNCKCPGDSCKCKPIAGWIPGKGFKKAMDEAKSAHPQQAAKAIAMKKAGITPKNEDVELAEEFDLIESIIDRLAEHNGVDAEEIWEDLETLTEDELYAFAVTSEPIMEYGDTKKGQKMLTRVQKRAVDRAIKADDKNRSEPDVNKRDLKTVRKNAATADRAWERMSDLDEQGVAEGSGDDFYAMALQKYPQLKRVDRETVINALNNAYEDYLMHYGYEGLGPDEESSMIDHAVKGLRQGVAESEAWQKANNRDRTDGMSRKAVNTYRREHPGSKLQTAVTTKPSKLKKGSKASKRRSSYCSRSRGQMKMHSISCSKTPDKAICKARRRWNC